MVKRMILSVLKTYQKIFSPDQGIFRQNISICRFYPSCSQYSYEAIEKFGIWQGAWLGLKRILRCHPWQPGGYDPLN